SSLPVPPPQPIINNATTKIGIHTRSPIPFLPLANTPILLPLLFTERRGGPDDAVHPVQAGYRY
ncbi:MAG TPA: hypothetical protein VFJ67_02690, partial [Thermodesulfobacteriota bacterium]|nr:hypothetical protein [Thermodesulfobacteriota bacterium]